jgi:hypothetical protein
MAFFDQTTAVNLHKRLYPEGLVSILMRRNPGFGLAKKWNRFGGEGKFLVWRHAPGAGSSSNFGDAQAGKSASKFKNPLITRKKEYGVGSIDGETMDATMGDRYAVAEAYKVAMDDAMYSITRSAGINMYGNGGGMRGEGDGSWTVAGTTLTFKTAGQAKNFEEGMIIQAATTDGTTGSVKAGQAIISAVNLADNTIECATNFNAAGNIPTIANSDFLFRKGDFGNVFTGFGRSGSAVGWIPVTAPAAAESHFGADRSSSPERLGGLRYAPGSGLIEEIFTDSAAFISDLAHGVPDTVLMNPRDWGNLVKEVGSKRYVQVGTDRPTIGYRGFEIDGPEGAIRVVPDPNCPRYQCWMGEIGTLEIWSLGEFPRVLQRSGEATQREATDDAEELRVGGYLQMVITDPGAWCAITLPS